MMPYHSAIVIIPKVIVAPRNTVKVNNKTTSAVLALTIL
jgi:hypothetical protein